jgi:hypothetical protein
MLYGGMDRITEYQRLVRERKIFVVVVVVGGLIVRTRRLLIAGQVNVPINYIKQDSPIVNSCRLRASTD